MGLRGPLRCGLVFVFYLASRPRTPPRLDVEQRAWYVIINTHGVTPWLGPYPGGAASSQASIILECVSAIQLPGPWRPRPQYKPNLAPGLWSRWGPKDTTSRRPPQRMLPLLLRVSALLSWALAPRPRWRPAEQWRTGWRDRCELA